MPVQQSVGLLWGSGWPTPDSDSPAGPLRLAPTHPQSHISHLSLLATHSCPRTADTWPKLLPAPSIPRLPPLPPGMGSRVPPAPGLQGSLLFSWEEGSVVTLLVTPAKINKTPLNI